MASGTLLNNARKPRHDGWTQARRRAFLDLLGEGADVLRAALRVGMSRRSAYRLRTRDEGFAQAWEAALRASRAADERHFVALLTERCPWARELFPDRRPDEGRFLPQDSVPSEPPV